MRELRFVTLTEDGDRLLVETADGDEQFALSLDAALREAMRSEPPGRPGPGRHDAGRHEAAGAPAPEPAPAAAPISPREIQVRVRAGESPQDLATAFGMSLDRVMRFAGAAVEERSRIKDEARRARARRSTAEGTESKLVQFGEAVDDRFRAHGIEADSVSWDARRRDDGEWLVVAEWLGGDARHCAEWLFSRTTRTVAPLDDTAVDLLSDRPIRPVLQPGSSRFSAAADSARPSLSAAPPLAPGIVAFPPMPDAATGPVPRLDEFYDQDAPSEGPRETSAAMRGSATLDFAEPPLPLGIADPAARPAAAAGGAGALRNLGVTRRDETEDERAARARIPSWDDILLGIKRRD